MSQAGCLWASEWMKLELPESEQLAVSWAVLHDSIIFSFFLSPKLLGPLETLSVEMLG